MTTFLPLGEIVTMIERDLPGWDFLMRSNKRPDGHSDKPYFANIMTPDFAGGVALLPGVGYVDVSDGMRFTAYDDTIEGALLSAYNKAMAHFHGTDA